LKWGFFNRIGKRTGALGLRCAAVLCGGRDPASFAPLREIPPKAMRGRFPQDRQGSPAADGCGLLPDLPRCACADRVPLSTAGLDCPSPFLGPPHIPVERRRALRSTRIVPFQEVPSCRLLLPVLTYIPASPRGSSKNWKKAFAPGSGLGTPSTQPAGSPA